MSEFCSLGTHLHTPERLPCIGKKELFVHRSCGQDGTNKTWMEVVTKIDKNLFAHSHPRTDCHVPSSENHASAHQPATRRRDTMTLRRPETESTN